METVMTKVSRELCTGCGACMNTCRFDAIKMKPDNEGFLFPSVDEKKCTQCKQCVAVCPALKYKNKNTAENTQVYAAMASDELRAVSSSGGMFTLLAEDILQEGGAVCGAAYDADFNVRHIIIRDISDLEKIRGSKYVQSDTGMVYSQIEVLLKSDIKVLFTGMPCQVAGLYNFLAKDYENLYTMDLLCHGVPSPKVFDKYLEETFGKRRNDITKIDFRDKTVFGWSSSMNVFFSNGTEYRKANADDPYYRAFLPIISLRKSCAHCKFSPVPRVGDISIGDFWGISKYNPELNDKKGTSLVLVNSEKGRMVFEKMKAKMKVCEQTPLEWAIPGNATLARPFRSHPSRSRFFRDLDLKPLSELVDKAKRFYYDIGIAGLWYGLNYGSVLTYYALYETVRSMGFDALMINKPDFLWTSRYAERNSMANKFIYKHCNVSNIRKGKYGWNDLNNFCDTFIVGSDVVWNYQICGKEAGQFFFLDFVNDTKKKIAVASSFGTGYDAPEEDRILSEYYIGKFDHISVRETEAVDICSSKFGVKPDKIMDPVFMCDKSIYSKLADAAEHKESGEFLSTYILGPDATKASILQSVSELLGLPLKNIPNPNNPESFGSLTGLPSLKDQSVEDWIYHIKESSFFIGDSFHGLCFALIFEKPFLIVVNSHISGLCRFTTLLKMVGLENRLMYSDKDSFNDKKQIISQPINYERVGSILRTEGEKSRKWLYNAIKSDKRKMPSSSDLLISKLFEKIGELDASNEELKRQITELKEGEKNG